MCAAVIKAATRTTNSQGTRPRSEERARGRGAGEGELRWWQKGLLGGRGLTLSEDGAEEAEVDDGREGLETREQPELNEVLHERGGHGDVELEAVVDQES